MVTVQMTFRCAERGCGRVATHDVEVVASGDSWRWGFSPSAPPGWGCSFRSLEVACPEHVKPWMHVVTKGTDP